MSEVTYFFIDFGRSSLQAVREILLAKYLNVRGLRKNKIFILQQSTAGTCSWALFLWFFK